MAVSLALEFCPTAFYATYLGTRRERQCGPATLSIETPFGLLFWAAQSLPGWRLLYFLLCGVLLCTTIQFWRPCFQNALSNSLCVTFVLMRAFLQCTHGIRRDDRSNS